MPINRPPYLGAAVYLTLTLLMATPFEFSKGPEIERTILTVVASFCWAMALKDSLRGG